MVRVDLENYCDYCPHFEPKVEKTVVDSKNYGEINKVYYMISCKHRTMCKNIEKDLLKRLEKGENHE